MIGRLAFLSIFVAMALYAQAPHEDWRTVATPHFRVHYPAQYEAWATRAAARLESVRAAVVAEVGFAPETVTDVLIENPIADANGITIALLDTPRIALYAEPPEPETQIGEYSNWIDLLTVHETAHLVHLLRPSRNPLDRALAHLLPLNPITLHAPRWVLEGYATLIEGRITGSGRPSGAMRAAVLRTWAMNGQLPTYAQLNSDRRFLGMSMAYLAGSAFLEWLVEKNGPDSLRNLWARMTARQRRSFDSAFTGVFGDTPQRLYGQFTAELSANAMTVAHAGGWKEGALWQETTRGSGDPAVSPDGTKLALVLRNAKGEATLAIFGTGANEEEAKNAKRIAEILRRDPQDVAPVRTKPVPRKPLHSFKPPDGGDIENPRWTRDGTAIIFTHKQPDIDGFLHDDLFRWTPEHIERLTHLADVKDADPIDATHAIAVRSRFGESQIVIVDLTTGAITPRTEPSLDIVDSHPRAAIDGRIAWAEHANGEWRVAIDGTPLPVAGAFSPEWTANGPLVAAVAGRGFIDIARIDQSGASYVTRTAGMALSPAPSPDGSLYFMSLDPDGFVVRHLADPTPLPSSTLTFDRSLVPALPPPPSTPIALHDVPVTPHPYALGRQEWSTTFGGQYTPFGHTTEFGLRLGDAVGRLDTLILGAISTRNMPRGFAVASVYRGLPITISAHAFDTRESRGLELRATRDAVFPLSHLSISAGGLVAQHRNRAFVDAYFTTRQRRIASERIDIAADSANHLHATARAAVHAGALTLAAALSTGRHLTLGGTPSSIEPDSLLLDRILDPAFARGTLTSATYRGDRLSVGLGSLTAFWQRHHLGRDLDVVGVESNISIPPMPLVKTPGLQLIAGLAQVRLTRKTRGWVGVRWKP
ncbi:MAG TPA: hypothetical protein VGQ65_04990 [Thermoanaerobaculia bacterium]|jgi:hypothetical protein|nr:hypothetical protein [Thermoanaerobaculia bacterium]